MPMDSSAPPRAASRRRNGRQPRNGQELRVYARERLIESRLRPNAISGAGLRGAPPARRPGRRPARGARGAPGFLLTQRLFALAGTAFVIGSVMDTLDGRY